MESPPKEPGPAPVARRGFGPLPVLARPVRAPSWPPALVNPLALESVPRGRAIGGCAVTLIVLVVTLEGVGALLPGREAPVRWFHQALVLGKWASALVAVLAAVALLRRDRLRPAAIGLTWHRLPEQVGWGLGTLFAVYAAMVVSILPVFVLSVMFPGLAEDLASRLEFVKAMPTAEPLVALLLLTAVAIHEEVIFRGLLIPYLRRAGLGWLGAATLSSVVFAVLHFEQGWLGVLQVFLVGLTFGVCFILSRSLLAVVLAHLCFNFLQFQLVRLLQPYLQQPLMA